MRNNRGEQCEQLNAKKLFYHHLHSARCHIILYRIHDMLLKVIFLNIKGGQIVRIQ